MIVLRNPPTPARAYLLAQGFAIESKQRHDHEVEHKLVVGVHLVAGEGGHGIEEQRRCFAELPRCHEVRALVHLQPVATVPVATKLREPGHITPSEEEPLAEQA